MYIIFNKELLYIENIFWDAMSVRHQHSEKNDLFLVCVYFLYFFSYYVPTCCHLYCSVVEERNKCLWSRLEESMASNQVLSSCCCRAVGAYSLLP